MKTKIKTCRHCVWLRCNFCHLYKSQRTSQACRCWNYLATDKPLTIKAKKTIKNQIILPI